MSMKTDFASRIPTARTALKLTQQQVADAVAISRRWYQQLEKGAFGPSFAVGIRVMHVLGISVDELLGEDGVHVPISTL